jgi:uncharacterized protein (TIGR04206 family)
VARATPRRRLAVLLALAVLPWTVVLIGAGVTLVFPFGLVTADASVSFVSLPTLLARGGGLPRNPELLPASVVLYLGALASAAGGVLGREDPRVTGGLLALAGVAHLGVSYALMHRLAYTPLPVGALALVACAWWYYWPTVRSTVPAE